MSTPPRSPDDDASQDWIVLAASFLGLSLAVGALVAGGLSSQSRHVVELLRSDIVGSLRASERREGFGTGTVGWSFATGDAGAGLQHSSGPGSDGAPGYLLFVDGGLDGAAYLAMPVAYRGDQAALMGGRITFDMNVMAGGAPLGGGWPLLRITGANGKTMTHDEDHRPARGGWGRVSVEVAPSGWKIDGRPATAEGMAAILADVARSEVRIEQAEGEGEVIGLDEVRFRDGS